MGQHQVGLCASYQHEEAQIVLPSVDKGRLLAIFLHDQSTQFLDEIIQIFPFLLLWLHFLLLLFFCGLGFFSNFGYLFTFFLHLFKLFK